MIIQYGLSQYGTENLLIAAKGGNSSMKIGIVRDISSENPILSLDGSLGIRGIKTILQLVDEWKLNAKQ